MRGQSWFQPTVVVRSDADPRGLLVLRFASRRVTPPIQLFETKAFA